MLKRAKSLRNGATGIHQHSPNLIPLAAFSISHTTIVNSLIMRNMFSSNLYSDDLLIEEILSRHQQTCLHQISCWWL